MSTPCEIVRYTPAHKRQVAQLETQLWYSDLPLAVRYIEWKYEQNPYASEPEIYLAFLGGKLVGVRGFYGSRWEAGVGASRVVSTIPVADDLIVAPEHRNRGVVTQIMRAALQDLAQRGHRYVLNLSGGQITVMGSLAMGWKSAGPLEAIGRAPRTAITRVRSALQKARFFWRFAESPLLRSGAERRPFRRLDAAARRGGPVAIAREPRVEAMSELVERLGWDGRIRHVRDPEFFGWRFGSPLASYRFLYVGGDRLEGYLVLRAPHQSIQVRTPVKIVDLEGSSAEVRSALLETAIDSGGFPGLYAWGATLPVDARDRLSALGFHPVHLEARAHGCPCVLVKAIGPDSTTSSWELGGRRLTDLADWDLRMLETMAG